VRAGIRRERFELFGKARPGFLRFEHRDSVVCTTIFPAPLGCLLATGRTTFAFDAGGGASFDLDRARRFFLRVDGGDLMIRYGFLTLRPNGEMADGFVGHNFRF
jgi:hypothetical protein